ncbi:3-deoxy-D-manno-octulosonic acid kinase [Marinobacter salinexigens]|uniref:3-deoxy-D-manno-octulosonic acid kinase n=1 Tax=Marinobacter salinexigens TaxID=2919747 RepID=A0A5B0VC66_9GAMM|nr:3-deoxy-D-manno-octulosonic acid kinase [Marinobacter salinexigens]KAA1171621.1 3-deoxy-D-manno-octulosonic acid kinase [Marinobacter salinexigens]
MADSEIIERHKGSALLVHPDYRGRVTAEWFSAEYWGDCARPVSSGGRGGAWFIEAGEVSLVLREYRRGGLAARISRKTYAYTKEAEVRSFSEFRLLDQLYRMGLPVPKPVGAWYRKRSPVQYQASIIIERLNDTVPLAELLEDLDLKDWTALGQVIRRFHDAGVRHADLNCFNVLVRGNVYYLIDFDKGSIVPPGSPLDWKSRNLERFARSIRKVAGDAVQARVWEPFMTGYNGSHSV